MELLFIVFLIVGYVVCPILAIVYGAKALAALLSSCGCHLVEHGDLHDAQAGGHIPPTHVAPLVGRVRAMRKSAEDARRAREKLRRRASRHWAGVAGVGLHCGERPVACAPAMQTSDTRVT